MTYRCRVTSPDIPRCRVCYWHECQHYDFALLEAEIRKTEAYLNLMEDRNKRHPPRDSFIIFLLAVGAMIALLCALGWIAKHT